MLFNRIDRSLVFESLKSTALIVFVLLLLIATNTLVLLLADVAAGAISLRVMGILILAQLIKITGFILAPAYFFAILWVLGRMYRDSEITALHSAGMSLLRLYRPFVWLSLPLSLLVALLVLWFYPQIRAYIDLIQYQEEKKIQISGLKIGTFNEFKQKNFLIYIADASEDKTRLKQVFVSYQHQGEPGILVAEQARIDHLDGGRFLVLLNGHRYQGNPGKTRFSVASFEQYGLRLPEAKQNLTNLSRSALPTTLLWYSDDLKLKAELQRRLSAPLSVFVLMWVALVLAYSSPRQGIYARLLTAILIYAIYLNLLQLAVKWMGDGLTPAWLGIWWVPALTVIIAALIQYWHSLKRQAHWRRWRHA